MGRFMLAMFVGPWMIEERRTLVKVAYFGMVGAETIIGKGKPGDPAPLK